MYKRQRHLNAYKEIATKIDVIVTLNKRHGLLSPFTNR